MSSTFKPNKETKNIQNTPKKSQDNTNTKKQLNIPRQA